MFSLRYCSVFVLLAFSFCIVACKAKNHAPPLDSDLMPNKAYQVDANPESGFHSPYFLLIPGSVYNGDREREVVIAVAPNNSGKGKNSAAFHAERALDQVHRLSFRVDKIGTILLVPAFPRPQGLIYTHALDRDSLTTGKASLSRPDLQLLAMIDDARSKLLSHGLKTNSKVFLSGFSASGMFTNRFTMLHPERVLFALIGSPGGWPTVPVSKYKGDSLPYPVGVADIEQLTGKPFDKRAYCQVPKLFYLGELDTNDSVPYSDSYDATHARLVNRHFGTTPVARWPVASRIYEKSGCSAVFTLHPNVGHHPVYDGSILEFIKKNLPK